MTAPPLSETRLPASTKHHRCWLPSLRVHCTIGALSAVLRL